jgi:hypothetical protein
VSLFRGYPPLQRTHRGLLDLAGYVIHLYGGRSSESCYLFKASLARSAAVIPLKLGGSDDIKNLLLKNLLPTYS